MHSDSFLKALQDGLTRPQKTLSPKWFYDAEGSALFEQITRLEAYYPTRQEKQLLRTIAPELCARVPEGAVLVEYGSGASEKTRILLDACPQIGTYVPIDISETMLKEAADAIADDYPALRVEPLVGDFLSTIALPSDIAHLPHVGFFPGSTIGNLEQDEAVSFLAKARETLRSESDGHESTQLILGVDRVKDEATLIRAYDDDLGVTARFNRNVLARANRELGLSFDLSGFAHRAQWNAARERVEMHLVSNCAQSVDVGGVSVSFRPGESIHTESSHKYTLERLEGMATEAGWRVADVWTSADPAFSVARLVA